MRITDILFPPKCVACGKVTEGEYLCADCEKKYRDMCGERCRRCGKPHIDCRCNKVAPADVALHLFEYKSDFSKRLIFALKRKNSRRLRDFLAVECKKAIFSAITDIEGFSDCVLTYVPRSREGISEYGFDQSKELCGKISKLTGIPAATLFAHRAHFRKQKVLTSDERKENAEMAYVPAKNAKAPYKVIIIDDVSTTGSTLSVCSKLARKLGAGFVCVVTAASSQ